MSRYLPSCCPFLVGEDSGLVFFDFEGPDVLVGEFNGDGWSFLFAVK